MTKAASHGGLARALAKYAAEQVLWARVRLQSALERRSNSPRPLPAPVPPTEVLRTREQWQAAVRDCRRLRLPLHHDRPKNWDSLGALSTALHHVGTDATVVDAGSARYSTLLPSLRLYGLTQLVGTNLEFGSATRHGPVVFRHGDITATDFADGELDAIACLSVIEHGVPVEPFLAESARILRPGGILVVSTDYDREPPDTTGRTAYGVPVHVFSPDEIQRLVKTADGYGLDLLGELELDHRERPIHWKRFGLDYTYLRLTFRRR
jgi:hypothetical protein